MKPRSRRRRRRFSVRAWCDWMTQHMEPTTKKGKSEFKCAVRGAFHWDGSSIYRLHEESVHSAFEKSWVNSQRIWVNALGNAFRWDVSHCMSVWLTILKNNTSITAGIKVNCNYILLFLNCVSRQSIHLHIAKNNITHNVLQPVCDKMHHTCWINETPRP